MILSEKEIKTRRSVELQIKFGEKTYRSILDISNNNGKQQLEDVLSYEGKYYLIQKRIQYFIMTNVLLYCKQNGIKTPYHNLKQYEFITTQDNCRGI